MTNYNTSDKPWNQMNADTLGQFLNEAARRYGKNSELYKAIESVMNEGKKPVVTSKPGEMTISFI